MMAVRKLDVEDLSHGGLSKPWEMIEIEKILPSSNEQPNAMRRYIQDFSCGSAAASFAGFHLVVPQRFF